MKLLKALWNTIRVWDLERRLALAQERHKELEWAITFGPLTKVSAKMLQFGHFCTVKPMPNKDGETFKFEPASKGLECSKKNPTQTANTSTHSSQGTN